ncbi:inositol monophosphatase [Fontivita pretiosa]|uniref:inositol monophosphatase n=1 Tax=Fontivita pretiosa TaxID=2989684 RepID=UPI003D176DE9
MSVPMPNPDEIVRRLIEFQSLVRDAVVKSHGRQGLAEVARSASADTIYTIDAVVEPVLEDFCRDWARTTPLVLIAEGIQDEHGNEGAKVFPEGSPQEDAQIRLIVDPIDGTRGIMYAKRPAWALAGVAPNKGPGTRLRDIEVAVMTELPTSKMGFADVLWAIRGRGAHAKRIDLRSGDSQPLAIRPSQADNIAHGFAGVSNFFPGTKLLASALMEHIARQMLGSTDVTRATVFEDQYISTGGQFYELIVGHDRFNADLRPLFYRCQPQPLGLCVHPYDVATWLIAEEAGVILTDGLGRPMDGPLDVTSNLGWAGFANRKLYDKIQPLIIEFFRIWGIT